MENQYRTADEYIKTFPEALQAILRKMRQTIRRAAPEAEEMISYRIPAYKQGGVLVYFAAFKDHIGFFPTSSGVAAFKKELAAYSTSKGTIRFPLSQPIPYDLVGKIVKFRVRENLKKQT